MRIVLAGDEETGALYALVLDPLAGRAYELIPSKDGKWVARHLFGEEPTDRKVDELAILERIHEQNR